MRIVAWLFKLAVFLVLMGFALSNTETATLRFFGVPEFEWRGPMILFLLVFFAAGVLVGVIAALPMLLRQRRGLARLRRELEASTRAARQAATPAPADASRPTAEVLRDSGLHGL
jgi:putative membrane protein